MSPTVTSCTRSEPVRLYSALKTLITPPALQLSSLSSIATSFFQSSRYLIYRIDWRCQLLFKLIFSRNWINRQRVVHFSQNARRGTKAGTVSYSRRLACVPIHSVLYLDCHCNASVLSVHSSSSLQCPDQIVVCRIGCKVHVPVARANGRHHHDVRPSRPASTTSTQASTFYCIHPRPLVLCSVCVLWLALDVYKTQSLMLRM